MKRMLLIIATMFVFFFVNAQTGDEMYNAKSDTAKKAKKEKKEKQENSNEGAAMYCLPDMSLNIDMNRGVVLNAGVRLVSGTAKIKSQYLSLNFSVPCIPGGHTAIGAFYKMHPFNGAFGKMIGVGLDFQYYFKSDWRGYTEWFYGGKVSNTLKGPGVQWEARRLVLAPRIEILVPAGNWKIGVSSNPLMLGYWDFDLKQKKWGACLRWYDIAFTVQHTFGTKKYRKFKEGQQAAK